jgi:hypothetical protein
MINGPKVIKDELFRTLVIKDICEIISDSLIFLLLLLLKVGPKNFENIIFISIIFIIIDF